MLNPFVNISRLGNSLFIESLFNSSATQLIPFELTPITTNSNLFLKTSLIDSCLKNLIDFITS